MSNKLAMDMSTPMVRSSVSEWHGDLGGDGDGGSRLTVVVVVRGGVVQGVLAPKGTEVDVIDFDALAEKGPLEVKRAEKKISVYERLLAWVF